MVRLGVIGIGYWGPNLVRNFNELSNCKIIKCCDLDTKKLENIRQKYPDMIITKDYLDIIKDKNLDAVIIATNTKSHYKIVKDVLSEDKHVFVEKPLTTNSKECLELIDLAKKKNKVLMVGYVFEYNSAIKKLKEYIENGELGKINYIDMIRTGHGPIRQDVNVMWDLAPHDIYILLKLIDSKPDSVIARGKAFLKNGVEDVVYINLTFPNNKIANIHVSWLNPAKKREITIVGDKKMAIFNDISQDRKIELYDKGAAYSEISSSEFDKFQLLLRDGDITIPKINLEEPLKTEAKEFISCILENRTPLSDGIKAYYVTKILEAAEESLKKNGGVIKIVY
ncbi:MAG: Gfo/Idh/MocA family oxidoreductase [Nanoarchaeota archaeon]|nr:Gfo/Idh/MocA family oxidoreductase [Nanoarchaeota archaeon]